MVREIEGSPPEIGTGYKRELQKNNNKASAVVVSSLTDQKPEHEKKLLAMGVTNAAELAASFSPDRINAVIAESLTAKNRAGFIRSALERNFEFPCVQEKLPVAANVDFVSPPTFLAPPEAAPEEVVAAGKAELARLLVEYELMNGG